MRPCDPGRAWRTGSPGAGRGPPPTLPALMLTVWVTRRGGDCSDNPKQSLQGGSSSGRVSTHGTRGAALPSAPSAWISSIQATPQWTSQKPSYLKVEFFTCTERPTPIARSVACAYAQQPAALPRHAGAASRASRRPGGGVTPVQAQPTASVAGHPPAGGPASHSWRSARPARHGLASCRARPRSPSPHSALSPHLEPGATQPASAADGKSRWRPGRLLECRDHDNNAG